MVNSDEGRNLKKNRVTTLYILVGDSTDGPFPMEVLPPRPGQVSPDPYGSTVTPRDFTSLLLTLKLSDVCV